MIGKSNQQMYKMCILLIYDALCHRILELRNGSFCCTPPSISIMLHVYIGSRLKEEQHSEYYPSRMQIEYLILEIFSIFRYSLNTSPFVEIVACIIYDCHSLMHSFTCCHDLKMPLFACNISLSSLCVDFMSLLTQNGIESI